MDRELVYPFQQPAETDLLNAQKNAYLGLAQLAQAVIGTGPALVGLACTPGTGLTVSVAAGQIYQTEAVDTAAYSSLPADSRTILKQGIVWTPTVLNCPAPGTAGQSINYLVEVGLTEADTNPVILPFYNASNPTVPYNGPNGSGVPSNTIRSDECVVQVKAGTAATTGTQTTPAADAGFVGIYVVTVAYGAASITSGNISLVSGAPFIQETVGNFMTVAGNPNGVLGGTAGTPGTAFPSMVWDTSHNILWVCTTSGTPGTAVWTNAGTSGGTPPFWCGASTGTANAQTVTTPSSMLAFPTGTSIAFQIGAGLTNTSATSVTVGTFGTFPVRKDSPTGPIALTGGELVAGNIVSGRFDGTYIQLTATEMGTAALANASSNTGVVAAVSGSGGITPGHLAVFGDALGTVADGGLPTAAGAPTYINTSQTIGPGQYLVDTSAGAITLTLGATLTGAYVFIDAQNSWGTNNLTIAGNGHNIGNNSTNVAATFLANVSDYQFTIEASSTYWRLV